MNQSDTPRTDEAVQGVCNQNRLSPYVPASFARQLERDLIRLSAERETEREELRKVDLVRQNASHAANLWESVAKDRERANEVLRSTIDDLEKEREDQVRSNDRLEEDNLSLRATLAERDKELAEAKATWNEFLNCNPNSPFATIEKLTAQLLAAQTVNGKLREALKRVDDLIIRRNESGIERFWDDLNGVKSFAKEALALSPDPTLLDEVKREKELIKDVEETLAAIDKAIAQLFWTSDDGSTQRDGTPEDGDAPPFITEAWKDIRSSLSRLRQSTHSGESHAD